MKGTLEALFAGRREASAGVEEVIAWLEMTVVVAARHDRHAGGDYVGSNWRFGGHAVEV